MRKTCARLTACLLTCLMLLTLVPFSAGAAQTEPAAQETVLDQAGSVTQNEHSHGVSSAGNLLNEHADEASAQENHAHEHTHSHEAVALGSSANENTQEENFGNVYLQKNAAAPVGQAPADTLNLNAPSDDTSVDAEARFTVALSSRLRSGGSSLIKLKGGGEYDSESEAVVVAFPKKGFTFVGWFRDSDTGYTDCLSRQQSYTFTVTEDVSLIALFDRSTESVFNVAVNGSRFKVNDGSTQANSAKYSFNAGERVFVSYTDTSMKFLYWENASRNIVSTEKDYSFVLVNDVRLNAIYTPVASDDTTALVVFRNAYQQILWTHTYSESNPEPIFFPSSPNKMGYTFREWQLADDDGNPTGVKATDASIRAAMNGNDEVIVVPVYTAAEDNTYSITLRFIDGDGKELKDPVQETGTLGDAKIFSAPKIEGKYFQYWKLNGTICGYTNVYTLLRGISDDVVLEAVYGDTEIDHETFIGFTQVFCSKNADKYVLSHTMQYYIPEDWTMAQAGFLYTADSAIGASEDSMVTANGSVKRHIIGYTDNRLTYTFNLNTSRPDKVYYFRGYINYKDASGLLHTEYTPISIHSYNEINSIRYTVKWINTDGTLLYSDPSVPFGAIPEYQGDRPSLPVSNNIIYTFDGWTPEVSAVTADVTYTAKYLETQRTFSGPQWNWNGTSSATASFTADDDSSVVQTVEAQIDEVEIAPASCTASGQRKITATAVFEGKTYTDEKTDEIPALGHDLEHHEAQAPTADSVGWEEYDTCTRCDYTTYVEIPKLPAVTVTEEASKTDIPVYAYNQLNEEPVKILPKLDAVYKFTAVEPEQATAEYYGNRKADYRVVFDRNIKAESFGLYGAYNGYGNAYNVAFLSPTEVAANNPVYLLEAAGLGSVTYNDIKNNIKEFICGVFNLDDANTGTQMTVELVIWEDGKDDAIVIASQSYTFGDAAEINCNHTWSEWEQTTNPTCTEKGKQTRTCSRCGAVETRDVPALGHDLAHHAAQAATCTEKGWEAYDTCSRCDYTTYVEIPALGHTSGEPVRENEVPATCTAEGSYEEVVYCSVCHEELSRETKTIEKLPHTPAEAVRENEVPATCTTEGSYEEVVYCSVCHEELSRETKPIEKIAHTPAEAVRENEVPATCTAEGSYDEVIYCSVCGEELSRETKTVEKLAHTPAEAVRENEVPATCTEVGSYDEVVYCSVCGEELSRETKTVEKLAHTPADAVRENEVPATCTAEGSYDEVVYCSVCHEELSRKTKTIEKLAHTPDAAVRENEVSATCTAEGSYDEVVYCSVCHEELSRETKPIEKIAHTPAEPVRENEVSATCTAEGSYEEVVYCSVCGEELSRTAKTIPALGHDLAHHAAQAPTADSVGWEAYDTCKRCDYTTYVEIPKLPAVTVTEEASKTNIPVYAYNQLNEEPVKILPKLDAVYKFTAVEPEQATAEYYGNRKADYRVVFDRNIKAESFGLYGAYNGYGNAYNVAFLFPTDVVANNPVYLLEAAGLGSVTYNDVKNNIKEFICGVFNLDGVNTGTQMTVELVIWEDGKDDAIVIASQSYTFGDAAEINCNHTWSEWEQTTNPTCTEKGKQTRTCLRCGAVETRDVPVLGHDLAHHAAQAATCTEKGWEAYDTCSRCDYTTYVEIPALGHTPDAAVRENEVPATCTAEGSYDEVIYCSVCGEELSRETKPVEKLAHTPAEAVRENEVPATCTAEGSYEEVVYCSVCGEELSRETKTVEKIAHTPAEAVRENEVPATCTAEGSYEEVAYCSVCGEELNRETKTVEKLAHTPAEAVRENEVPATCTAEGSYEEVVYCSVCHEELSRETKAIEKIAHTPAEAVHENEVPATCTAEGSYEEVVYCSVCGEELSRETKTIEKLAHTPDAAVRENEVSATCTAEGSYDEVIYCSVCNEELSRTAKTIPALGHDLEHHEAQAPTADSVGWEAYDTCTRCDYTTYVEIPKLPAVTVTEEASKTDIPVYAYNQLNEEPVKILPKLDAVYKFTAVEPEQATAEYYGNRKADYRVVFDRNIKAESFGLYGAYNGYGNAYNVAFLFPTDVAANNPVYLLEAAGLGSVTYNDIKNNIKEFICGVFNLDGANTGTQMTVELVIWEDGKDDAIVIASQSYTFGDAAEINCNHTWSEWEQTTNPTCTEKGKQTRTCSRCGAVETRDVPALGHDLKHHAAQAATCTEKGWEAYDTCSRCDYTTYVEIAVLGHDLEHHAAQAATCTEKGWEAYDTCSRCDYTTYVEIPVLGHDLEHHAAQAATCTEKGWEAYDTCSRCDYTTYVEIAVLGHDLEHHAAQAATCTEKGWEAYDTCSRCDYTTYVEIPVLGHTSGEPVRENEVSATCTEAGSYDEVIYCSVCNEELSRTAKTIPALGHDLAHHAAQAATCTEKGWEAYDTCSRCDYTTYVEIAVLGHDLEHHAAQAATCTEKGWEAYDTCSRCDYTTYVEIPALGHDLEHHEAQAATCTEKGWEAYDTCSRCDYTTYVEIPVLGHDLAHHAAQAATCTEKGWEAYDTCSRCDYTTYVEIPALGHDLEHHEAQAATCTEKGWEAYDTCSRCDYTTYVEIAVLGHDLEHHAAQAATCTEKGWEAYDTCSRCDYTTYVEIPALGHDLEHHEAQAATCTEKGWEAYDTCSRCDYTTYVEIPALGHDLAHHAAQAATCTEKGWEAYDTCSRCDYTTYVEIAALGHDWDNPVWTWTGTSSATAVFTCKRDSNHHQTKTAAITSAAGTGENAGYMVYTATVTFNGKTYQDTNKGEAIAANSFTHSDNLAHTDTYLYRVGNGNTVALGTLFKVVGAGTPNASNVKIKVEAVENNSSVKGTGTNLESDSTAKCVYTKNTSDWEKSTLKFTGEGPVKVTISEDDGPAYTLNLEVVTGNNYTDGATLGSSASIVLLGNVKLGASSGKNPALSLNGKNLYGNGFEIDATGSNISTQGPGIIWLTNSTIDNAIVIGPTFNDYKGKYGEEYYAATIACLNNSEVTNCRITGASAPVMVTKTGVKISDTVLVGGIFANLSFKDSGSATVKNVTTINTQNSLGIVFIDGCDGSITIEGTLDQHNFISENATTISSHAKTLKNKMFESSYSKYQFTSGGTKYVNTGIISMSSNVGADQIIDNRSDKKHYSGSPASISIPLFGISADGYVYTMENTDPSMLETSYTEPAYTPSVQVPYSPVFSWTVPSTDNVAAGGDSHCYKDSSGVLQIQFPTGGSKTINPASYQTFKKYGGSAIAPSSVSCIKNASGANVPVANGNISFTEAGEYTISYHYNNVPVYDKDLATTTAADYTKTIKVNVAVKKAAPNAVITSSSDTGTMEWGGAGTSYDPDYNPCIPFLDGLTIKDYDANGEEYTVLDGANQSSFIKSIASVSVSGTTVTITLANGTKLVVIGPAVDGTVQIKANNNKLYYCDSKADNNPAAFTKTFAKNSFTYTGENGVAVSYGTARSFTSTTSTSTIATYSSMTTPWTTNKFLMFDAQGGTVSPSYTGTSPATLPEATREGYTLLNWNTKADGSGTARNAGTSMSFSSTTTLYAIWAKNVEVTFESEGSMVTTISGGAGTSKTLPTATQSTQWLEGWYTEEDGGKKIGNAGESFTVPQNDTTYYAHWNPKYVVSYNANGGTVSTDSAVYEGTALTLPAPTNGSKTFEGWYTAASGGTKIGAAGDSYVPTANIELFAQWSDNILVTFNANGGTAGTNSATYDRVTPITLPTATWAGHQFNGWYTAATGGTKVGDAGESYIPAANIELFAQWTAYTVTYNANSGSVNPASASAGDNGAVTLPTPTRTGYTFNGWYTAASGGNKIGNGGDSYTLTEDTTIYAQWTLQTFTVTISAGTGGSVSPKTISNVPYGATVSVSGSQLTINGTTVKATANSNYEFTQWNVSNGTTITKDTTITASFKSTSSGCVPSGTMITMADGSQKAVEDLTEDDRVLVFNHETGKFEEQGIIFYEADGVDDYKVINLSFSDGSVTRLIYEHGYFDLDLMQYVYIREDNYTDYIGHRFAKTVPTADGYDIESVTLTDAWVTEEHTGCFSFPSTYCLNFIADGFLSMPGGIDGMFNFFDYDENLKYDEAAMAADIETYGLLDYSYFEEYLTYEEFSAYPAQYLGVALGKGLMTQEQLAYLINRYVVEKR